MRKDYKFDKKLINIFIFFIVVSCVETTPNQTSNSFQSTENSVTETPQDRFEANTPNTGSLVNFFQINSENLRQIFP